MTELQVELGHRVTPTDLLGDRLGRKMSAYLVELGVTL